jgi:triosephosphate isomerase
MTRKPFVAGNWKMNGDLPRTRELCADLVRRSATWPDVDVAVCPPYVGLAAAAEALRGGRILLGAQNMHEAASGAYTGEVSAGMLLTAGCQLVILGHSERRRLFGETDAGVNGKLHSALAARLGPIVCVGETLEEREAGSTERVIETQLSASLKDLTTEHLAKVTIAYEPVWAIGTGRVATISQASEVHRFIRHWIGTKFGARAADNLRIQYGGSVKADNARGLLSDPDIDGALVGGASLDAGEFEGIIRAAV